MNIAEVNAILQQAALFHKKGAGVMPQLLSAMGNPENGLKFAHIAGTNGKGSAAKLMSAALTSAGYRTGLFTSPYVNAFNERIAIDGAPISDEALCLGMEAVWPEAKKLFATFFEIITAIGLWYFHNRGCEIVVLETGLGGRLDPTNAIPCPEIAVIGQIGLDHTAILGDSIEQIAWEKAGIIKPGGEVVLLRQSDAVQGVIAAACVERGAALTVSPEAQYRLRGAQAILETPEGELTVGLLGEYQAQNALLAYTALLRLRAGGMDIPFSAIRDGFALARWPGRFERLFESPLVILDGAHNPQGVQALLDSLKSGYPEAKEWVFVAGMMKDKDCVASIGAIKPLAKAFLAVPMEEERAHTPEELSKIASALCIPASPEKTLEAGVEQAVALAGAKGHVCIFGSLHLCGPVRRLFGIG